MAAATTYVRTSHRKINEELMMECDDDDLSPSQLEQYHKQIQAIRNHNVLLENYKLAKARREEQDKLRKLEEKKALMAAQRQAIQISSQSVSKPVSASTIQGASGIVQNIAKQLVRNQSLTSNAVGTQPIMLSQYGQDGSYVCSTGLLSNAKPSQTNVLASNQRVTTVSAVPTQQFYIQKPVSTVTVTKPSSVSLPHTPGQIVQVHQSPPAGSTTSPRQVQIESGASTKSNVKTTVIRVPTGINIQQHLGTNYKLLTSTGNVYHYVYSPATTTTAVTIPSTKPLSSYQQVIHPSQIQQPPQYHQPSSVIPPSPIVQPSPVVQPASIKAPKPPVQQFQPKVSPSYPASITDILLGKRPNQMDGRSAKPTQAKKHAISTPMETAASKRSKTVEEPVQEEPTKVKEPKYSIDQFYGTRDGNRNYPDDKYKYGFKCYHCTKLISNNIKYMAHIKNHLDKEKQENLTLNDIINCDHCGRRFNTPFELQCHIEKSHITSSDLSCRICDLTLDTKKALVYHLTSKHPPLQMPYSCPICQFRSSFLDVTIEHFKAKHEGIKKCLCTHCLKSSGDANSYLRHCQKHQTKSGNIRCKKCKLMFVTSADLKAHDANDHVRFPVKLKRKQTNDDMDDSNVQVMEVIPPATAVLQGSSYSEYRKKRKEVRGDARKGTLESYSLNDWKSSFDKSRKHEIHRCSECGSIITSLSSHFATFLKCSHCQYRTYCGQSFSNHMIKFHRTVGTSPNLHPVSKMSGAVLKCLRCSFTTESGSAMAGHVMTCINGPTDVEGFKHHTRPRRPDDLSTSSSNSNSPIPKQDMFEKEIFDTDNPLLDEVSVDNIHESVSNIIDRLFGNEDDSNPGDDESSKETATDNTRPDITDDQAQLDDTSNVKEKEGEQVGEELESETDSQTKEISTEEKESRIDGEEDGDVCEDETNQNKSESDVEDMDAELKRSDEERAEVDEDSAMETPDNEAMETQKNMTDTQEEGALEQQDNMVTEIEDKDGMETQDNITEAQDSVMQTGDNVVETQVKGDDHAEKADVTLREESDSKEDESQKDAGEMSDDSFVTAPDASPNVQTQQDENAVEIESQQEGVSSDAEVESSDKEETINEEGTQSPRGEHSDSKEDSIDDDGEHSTPQEDAIDDEGSHSLQEEDGDAGTHTSNQEETIVDNRGDSCCEGNGSEGEVIDSAREDEILASDGEQDIKENDGKDNKENKDCCMDEDDLLLADNSDDNDDKENSLNNDKANDDELLADDVEKARSPLVDKDGSSDKDVTSLVDESHQDAPLLADEGNDFDKEGSPLAEESGDVDKPGLPLADEGNEFDKEGSPLAEESDVVDKPGLPLADEGNDFDKEGSPLAEESDVVDKPGLPLADEEVNKAGSSLAEEDEPVIPDGASIDFEDGERSLESQDFVVMDEWSDGEDGEQKDA